MTAQGDKLNRYGFIVDPRANKLEIKAAVEAMYGVVVTSVNTCNYMGKAKSRYTRAERFGSYSIVLTVPVIESLSRLKSTTRYIFL